MELRPHGPAALTLAGPPHTNTHTHTPVHPLCLPLTPPFLTRSPHAPQRYSALFALRNKGGREAVEALGRVFAASSALLKHEVAYVLGQMQDPSSATILTNVLKVRA